MQTKVSPLQISYHPRNPNHRGGAGTAKKRGGMTEPLSSGFVPRLTKVPQRPELIERAMRRAAKAA